MDFNQVIQDLFHDEFLQFDVVLRKSIENKNPRISDVVNHALAAKGKRIRPALVFLSAQSCGKITEATFHGAVTVELLHNATLLHDDVLDESMIRRNQPSVNAIFGNHSAILVGDYLLSVSSMESLRTGNLEIIKIVSELGKSLTEGEMNQYAIAKDFIIDEQEYFTVIDQKTASLISACTAIGAISAGASEEIVKNYATLGRFFGICFQLRDDLFDYFDENIGKPTGNDVREGKITLPLIYALRSAPKIDAEDMLKIIRERNYTDENVATLQNFAKSFGGIEYTQQKIDEYLSRSLEILKMIDIPGQALEAMNLLITYLKNRPF